MHAVVRRYSGQGASQLFDELDQNRSEVERVIRGVPGLVQYAVIRTADGGLSVTICQDKAGTDESVRIAADWIRQNVKAQANPPEVTEGDIVVQLT